MNILRISKRVWLNIDLIESVCIEGGVLCICLKGKTYHVGEKFIRIVCSTLHLHCDTVKELIKSDKNGYSN